MKLDALAGGLPGLSVRRPHLAAVMNILIIIAGISALLGVEVRELPDIDRPIVSVRANYPGASPTTPCTRQLRLLHCGRTATSLSGSMRSRNTRNRSSSGIGSQARALISMGVPGPSFRAPLAFGPPRWGRCR